MRHEQPTADGWSDSPEIERSVDTDGHEPLDLQGLLLDVSRLATSRRDLESLLNELVALLQRAVRFDRLAVVLHDPSRGVMRLHTLAAVDTAVPTVIELAPGDTPSGVAWQTQRAVVMPNVDRETRFPEIVEFLRSEGIRSFCAFPLTSPLRRLGALGFTSREEDAFSQVDAEFLQQLTNEVALAVDNTLHQQAAEQAEGKLRHERDRLEVLLEINNALVSNLDPPALFGEIATRLRRVVSHDFTALAIFNPERNGFEIRAIAFDGKGLIHEGSFVPMGDGSPSGIAFRTGKPIRFGRDDIEASSSGTCGLLVEEGVQSTCSLPMIARGRRVGTICVGRRGGEPFTDHDEEILAAAAGQIAFAVENALAFEEIAALKDKLVLEKIYLEDEIRTDYNFEEVVGESPLLEGPCWRRSKRPAQRRRRFSSVVRLGQGKS